jgi:hypothetical protein
VIFGLALVGASPSPGSRVGAASRCCRCLMCSCGPSPARQAAAASRLPVRGKQLPCVCGARRPPARPAAAGCLAPTAEAAPPVARKARCGPMPITTCYLRLQSEASRSHAPLSSRICPLRPVAILAPAAARRPVTQWLEGRGGQDLLDMSGATKSFCATIAFPIFFFQVYPVLARGVKK